MVTETEEGVKAENATTAENTAEEPKQKKRYSKKCGKLQELHFDMAKGHRKMVNAVNAGITDWINATDTSARNKKDGAVRDSFKNTRKAMKKYFKEAEKANKAYFKAASRFARKSSKV